ncbi:hypothetical protein GCM10010124_11550 [Pilimelia terevasa]|uniref:PatA-like N-terminal domain-containing protein n=1 Tax=Pilimelia terevasa TaxID=53372 RepID=A0A8J3FHC1_9ACTN|nr:DUF4388 domain-containing protein [Pilimelia terevasa]GGK20694.1 hypothetical protein GCM10010124_11550 [Pilimelia terevasa]
MTATSPAEPHRVLAALADTRASGALHIGSDPPGVLHLVGGAVTHASSPLAPGVGELLTIGGRLSGEVWRLAVDAGTPEHRVGPLLVEQGHLTRGELELCVLGVIYDATYFVLVPRAVPVRFEPDRPHWLGAVAAVPVPALVGETARRRRALTEILDRPEVDSTPVVPVPRLRRDRIRLSGLQWELIVHADGQRTPTGLARRLGRASYACLQETRRLAAEGLVRMPPANRVGAGAGYALPAAAAGLPSAGRREAHTVEVPAQRGARLSPAPGAGPAVGRHVAEAAPAGPPRAEAPTGAGPAAPTQTGASAGAAGPAAGTPSADGVPGSPRAGAPPGGDAAAGPGRSPGGSGLPRRQPAPRPPGDAAPPVAPPDEALLLRLRSALWGMA